MNLVTVGQMFGRWCVLSSEVKIINTYRYVDVECTKCGAIESKSYDNLKSGKSKGCNTCRADDRRIIPNEYKWLIKRYEAAQGRCRNPKDKQYHNYGGRGIELRFNTAKEYVDYVLSLPGADRSLEIDRIDNNGHYEIGNLRWATRQQQTSNTRKTRRIEYDGKEMSWSTFVKDYTDLSISRADVLLSQGLSLKELTEYKPANLGQRARNLRLGRVRPKP